MRKSWSSTPATIVQVEWTGKLEIRTGEAGGSDTVPSILTWSRTSPFAQCRILNSSLYGHAIPVSAGRHRQVQSDGRINPGLQFGQETLIFQTITIRDPLYAWPVHASRVNGIE